MKTIVTAIAGLAAVASAQPTLNLRWEFWDAGLTGPITTANVGDSGFAVLYADFSNMNALFGASGNRQGFQAAFIGGDLVSSNLGYVIDSGTGQASAFDAFGFGFGGFSGTATGGAVNAGGTDGWFVAAANVFRFNGTQNPAEQAVALFEITYSGAGVGTISTADFGLEFGLFAITRANPLTLNLNDGVAFNETALTVSQTAGSIEIVPTPAVAALAGFGGVVAARRRR